MDNVVSIFSRKTPCDNLLMNKEEFNNFYSLCIEEGRNNHDSHVDTCTDCSQRYFVENRNDMQEKIKLFLKTLSEGFENPNA